MTERIPEESLTKQEAADRLKVSTRTINRYLASGELPHSRLPGGLVRIPVGVINAMLTPPAPALAEGGDAA